MTPHPQLFAKLGDGRFEGIQSIDSLTKTTIVFRFWPSPAAVPVHKPSKLGKKGKKSLTYDERKAVRAHEKLIQAAPDERLEEPAAPILELRLAATDTEILGVESLCAIKRIHNTDVLLPSSPVDVRFTQTQYAALHAKDSATLAGWQPIIDFVASARLDLADGKLEARPDQRFHVPRHLFADWDDHNGSSLDRNELVGVQYTFAGLEVHRSLELPYEGHRLTYTSIEAGRGGGRRAEITLEPVAGEEGGKTTSQEDFLASCFKFATDEQLW